MNLNVLWVVFPALVLLFGGGHLYSRYVSRIFHLEPNRPTPAVEKNDGTDYVPTRTPVLFGHHFASIAGAGPIVGPVMALAWGYGPGWLWVVLGGGLFFGAVHDFGALFLSVRDEGRSMADVVRGLLGRTGFYLFIIFTLFMLLLVMSAFLNLTATALTSTVPLSALSLSSGEHILPVMMGPDGTLEGKIGGIASTSVIVITLAAPIFGFLLYRRNLSMKIAIPLAIGLCAASVLIGLSYPVGFSNDMWRGILCVYVFFATGIPVWIVLQPRDFVNVFILYGGMVVMIAALIIAGINGDTMQIPLWNIAGGSEITNGLPMWPFLFILIACGAISGFHSIVGGGTSSKQIASESAVPRVGYFGMVTEALLAVCVIAVVGAGLSFSEWQGIVWPTAAGVKSNPILAFAMGMGQVTHRAFDIPIVVGTVAGILMVEGFIATTLDTAVRLCRYLLEELWKNLFETPSKILRSPHFNAAVSVALMVILAWNNAFKALWPAFGTANQLMAALTLIAITVWLIQRGKKYWFAFLPALFMLVTTVAALIELFKEHFPVTLVWLFGESPWLRSFYRTHGLAPDQSSPLLTLIIGLMIFLSVGVVILAVRHIAVLARAKRGAKA